ncbi:MAG: Maf family protein, partial [Sarcina sp.]
TGSPMDKAGAYGIQDSAAIFVEEIRGCYYNVMGLPVNVLYNLLKQLD